MTQAEVTVPIEQKQPRIRLGWVIGTFLTPARQLREVLAEHTGNWLTPLLVLSLVAIVEAVVVGNLPIAQGAMDPQMLGPGSPYQYYTPEQQAQLDQAMAAMDTPFFRIYLPAGLALAGVWIQWLVLGATLHLVLTFIGGRGGMVSALNLLAWASLPLAVRGLVHVSFVLSSGRALIAPGVSGLVPAAETGLLPFLAIAARGFDVYFLWQLALLAVGASLLSENRRARVWTAVSAVQIGFLAASAVPAYIVARLSDLTVIRPFMF